MSSIEEIRRRIGEVGKKLPADELTRVFLKEYADAAHGSIALADACSISFMDHFADFSNEFEHLRDRAWRSLPSKEADKVVDELYSIFKDVEKQVMEALNTKCGCKIHLPPKV
jgi:hypothetical protein